MSFGNAEQQYCLTLHISLETLSRTTLWGSGVLYLQETSQPSLDPMICSILPSWFRLVWWSAFRLRHASSLSFRTPPSFIYFASVYSSNVSLPCRNVMTPLCDSCVGECSLVGGTRVPFYLIGTSLRTNHFRGRLYLRPRPEEVSPYPTRSRGSPFGKCVCVGILSAFNYYRN